MAKVSITTNDGELVEQIDADQWDLNRPVARVVFHQEVDDAVTRAKEMEQ